MSKIVSKLKANDRIHQILQKEHGRANITVSLKQRISIILSGIAGKSIYQTFHELETTYLTVKKWRKRWKESYDRLQTLEKRGIKGDGEKATDRQLLKLITEILSDRPRCGTPKRITMSQEDQIVALATRKPEDYDIPMTNWTHVLLAQVAMSEQIVEHISASYVGIILKKTN